jgi:bacterioferritin (cytochrome b1)
MNVPSLASRSKMVRDQLIEKLQFDLKNERKHMLFYLQAAVLVRGLHREEFSEFFYKEAQSEMKHVEEFSRLIVHLGGIPGIEANSFVSNLREPEELLQQAVLMEEQVANIYAQRLRETHDMEDADIAYVHVFYEEQIADSWKTAQELRQMI